MKKNSLLLGITVIAMLLITSSIFAGEDMEPIKVGKGTLKMGGVLQAGYSYNMEDTNADGDCTINGFTMGRSRFLFWGTIIPEKVKYFLQVENTGGIGLWDFKAQFFYLPKTEITVGRFLPNFTLYMPISTAKLEMIRYPLTTKKFGSWRQTGIQSTTKMDMFDFNLGIFNGIDNTNNLRDNNDAQDLFARVDIHPELDNMKLLLAGYTWMGNTPADDPDDPENCDYTVGNTIFGGFLKLDMGDDMPIRLRAEYITGTAEAVVDGADDITSMAYFAHIGVQPFEKIEFLARYDAYDPNTDADDDGENMLTVGANYYLDGINSMFYLNFIQTSYENEDVDSESMIVAQVQIAF